MFLGAKNKDFQRLLNDAEMVSGELETVSGLFKSNFFQHFEPRSFLARR